VTASFAILTAVVPATTTLVDQGARVQAIVARYPQQVKVLQTVDPATLAALKTNPANFAAQVKALSELTAMPLTTVGRVVVLGSRYSAQLATVSAIDSATLTTLALNPTNSSAIKRAVAEIASKFGIPPGAALARLAAVAKVPVATLQFLRTNGPPVRAAAARLRSVSSVPPADVAYLSANGAKVAKAKKDNPGQWQTWWWVCFIAQIVFIPFVFLLTGRWSPRKAREDERQHERAVERELARLHAAEPSAV
jgi:ACS family D-galactonate transporter-like MFS transporter